MKVCMFFVPWDSRFFCFSLNISSKAMSEFHSFCTRLEILALRGGSPTEIPVLRQELLEPLGRNLITRRTFSLSRLIHISY